MDDKNNKEEASAVLGITHSGFGSIIWVYSKKLIYPDYTPFKIIDYDQIKDIAVNKTFLGIGGNIKITLHNGDVAPTVYFFTYGNAQKAKDLLLSKMQHVSDQNMNPMLKTNERPNDLIRLQ